MSRVQNLASERGAVLVQTAVAALVLVGFGTFVVDYGVLWVARHQAQNAADAGAMSGAIARAYEDFDDPAEFGGVAAQSASQVAGANLVWGLPATAADPRFDECLPPCRQVRVDVYRNGDHLSLPLPTWFGPVLGIASQGVKATATAQVLVANATNCLRPWAIPDKWTEGSDPIDLSFRKYADITGLELVTPHDDYEPPTAIGPGTGLTFATSNSVLGNLGLTVPLTFDDLTNPINQIFRGSLVPLDTGLPGGYAANVALDSCNGQSIEVGDQIAISAAPPQADPNDLIRLYNQDPGATWDAGTNTIRGSCAPLCAPISPRLVAMAVFDVDLFQLHKATLGGWGACPGGIPCVSVVNIVGFFIADNTGSSGYLTSYPGVIPTEAPKLTAESSFLKAITLVR